MTSNAYPWPSRITYRARNGSTIMVLHSGEMDQSDGDHSFELVDSDDRHTERSDYTDESFEIIGSEELNSVINDVEDLNIAANDEHWLGNMDMYSHNSDGSTYSFNALRIIESHEDDQELKNSDKYSHESTDSESTFSDSIYGGDIFSINEKDDKDQMSTCRTYMYEMGDINVAHELPKLRKDMELKDLVKDYTLPFLPAKSLVRFRTVSKDWNKWITHPFLAHLQSFNFQEMSGFFCQEAFQHFFVPLDKSVYGVSSPALSFLPRRVKIRSSCRGLVLCQGIGDQGGENKYYVCNPTNGEYHVLPESSYYHGSEPNLVLVFEPSPLNCGENYKVICAFDLYHDSPILGFDIYNSETRSWTCSDAVCPELGVLYLKDNGLYKDGVAYWATFSGELLAFDSINDICGVQPICSDLKAEGILTLEDGKLSYIQSYIEPSHLETSICCDETEDVKNKCIIEIYGGVTMCLERQVVVKLNMEIYDARSFRVVFAANSKFIFNINNILYSYDVKTEELAVISRRRISATTTCIPYVNSMVSWPGAT